MEQQRNILFILFLVLSLFLYWSWESDKIAAVKTQQELAKAEVANQIISSSEQGKSIKLISDALELTINLTGGDIIDAKLLKVAQEQGKSDPFHLLMTKSNFIYQAQSGLIGQDGLDSKARPVYRADQSEYKMGPNDNSVSAKLYYEKDGVTYTKIYTLYKQDLQPTDNQDKHFEYVVNVAYDVKNNTNRNLSMAFYGQLKQTEALDTQTSGAFGMVAGAYRGAAYSTEDTRYQKEKFDSIIDLAKSGQNISVSTKAGWVAMIQHYFVTAFIGDSQNNQTNVIYTNSANSNADAIIGIRTEPVSIAPNSTYHFSSNLWIGPKNQDQMEMVAHNLDLTVDYGWLWFISIPLFKILEFIHTYIISNWGFAIIILTLIVRSVLFPLTKAQYTSMAKMRLLTPKMQELRERYKDDRQKLGQETMRLYKTEKVNPLGGCFPLLIQMPIFIALYWTLMESPELRHAPFILWIHDLSVYDPYFVTPILYGISMFFIQKMSPTPVNDPIQRKVIMAMPVIFTFMFMTFPAGLTVYWLVSNLFTIGQQIIIYRSLEKRGLHVKESKK